MQTIHNILKTLMSSLLLLLIWGHSENQTEPSGLINLTDNPSIGLSLSPGLKSEGSFYTLDGQVSFSISNTSGNLIVSLDNELYNFSGPFGQEYGFSIENLPKDGAYHKVIVWLDHTPEAMVTTYFKAPTESLVNKSLACSIFATVSTSACESATNTYDVTGEILFFDPPSSGTLTVSVGSVKQVFNAPFTNSLNYSLLGMAADGSDHKLLAVFSDEPTCIAQEIYRAPSGCAADKCSISILPSAGACDPNTNQYDLTGSILLDNISGSGNLIIKVSGTSIQQTFTLPLASSVSFVLPGLPADGLEHEVVAWFESDVFCAATSLYNAPPPCNPDCDIDIVYWIGKCEGATDIYVLHGTVVLSNPPTTGTMTITVNGSDLIYNAPFFPVIGYTFTTLPADGAFHDIAVSFSDIGSCSGITTYQAPDICVDCSIEMEVIVGPCDPITNTYSVSGRLVLTNPPTPGFLTVDIEGNTHSFFAPFENKIHLYQIGGLPADGLTHPIEAVFSLENSCIVNDNYLAPICPTACNFFTRVVELNCCKLCPTGNLEVLLLHWKEDYTTLTNVNLALHKPSMLLGHPQEMTSNSKITTDGFLPGDSNGVLDFVATPMVNDPWYHLDLVGVYDLSTITIWGRNDCCQTENIDYMIFTSSEPFPALPYTELMNDPNINHYNQSVVGGDPVTINLNGSGRFIRIQRIGFGSLAIGEVEVIGSGSNSSSPYTYQWSEPSAGNTAQVDCLSIGNHCVTVTDNQTGCSSMACIDINGN